MTLCDAGPLVALVNVGDKHRERCVSSLPVVIALLLTTWPCFSEAMYLIGQVGKHMGRSKLWDYVREGLVVFYDLTDEDVRRMMVLMQQYHDLPMDLADASLVAAAETLGLRRVFSVDSDFYVYRLPGGEASEVIPGPA